VKRKRLRRFVLFHLFINERVFPNLKFPSACRTDRPNGVLSTSDIRIAYIVETEGRQSGGRVETEWRLSRFLLIAAETLERLESTCNVNNSG
jgi:hypothetical protein